MFDRKETILVLILDGHINALSIHVIFVVSNSNSFVLTFSVFHWISSPCGKRLNLLTEWKHIHDTFYSSSEADGRSCSSHLC